MVMTAQASKLDSQSQNPTLISSAVLKNATITTTKSARPSSVSPSPPIQQQNSTNPYQILPKAMSKIVKKANASTIVANSSQVIQRPLFDVIFPRNFSKERLEVAKASGEENNLNRAMLKKYLTVRNQTFDEFIPQIDRSIEYKAKPFPLWLLPTLIICSTIICILGLGMLLLVEQIRAYNRMDESDRLIKRNCHSTTKRGHHRRSSRRRILDDQLDVVDDDNEQAWVVTRL